MPEPFSTWTTTWSLGRAAFVLFVVVDVVFFGLVVFVVPPALPVVWAGVPSRLVGGTTTVGDVGASVADVVDAVELLSSTTFNTTSPTMTATATSTAPRPADMTT